MHFETIFSIENDGYRFVMGPLGGLIVLPVIVAAFLGAKRLFPNDPRIGPISIVALGLALTVAGMSVVSSLAIRREYQQLRQKLAEGRFRIVEGPISNLGIGRRRKSHHPEVSFDVAEKHFQLSDFFSGPQFTYSNFRRSGLAEGHYVRIIYSGDTIMRLEVREPQ